MTVSGAPPRSGVAVASATTAAARIARTIPRNIRHATAVTGARPKERIRIMASWKVLAWAYKVRRGWKRIPPAQRKKILKSAGKHGPVVAKRIGAAVRQVRKAR